VDPTGKLAGRGAYLHDLRSCWEKGLKGALAQALKTGLTEEEREKLADFAKTLPQTMEETPAAAVDATVETPARDGRNDG
jgi:predicted RNA-binding protein YlxR (DUF448 family)